MLLIAANENELSFIWRGTWLTLFLPRSPQSQVKRKEKVEKDERCNNILTEISERQFLEEKVFTSPSCSLSAVKCRSEQWKEWETDS